MSESVLIRVQETIDKTGLSDQEIAEILHVTKTTVWRWRTGNTKNFAPKLLRKISNKLQIDYEWLRHGKKLIHNNSVGTKSLNSIVHTLRETVDKQQQKIIILQDNLIDSKNELLDSQKKLILCKEEKSVIHQKYHHLKESILVNNTKKILNDSKFFEEAKKAYNNISNDTALTLIFIYLIM